MFRCLLFISLLFIGGCKSKTVDKEITLEKIVYKPEKDKDILESGLIKNITLIPLETLPECLLDAFALYIKDTHYYLVDYFKNGCVFRFNEEGKFLNRIGHRGNGPNEYPELSDFSFDNSGNLLLYSGVGESVYYYSLEGVFKNKIHFNQDFHKAINDNENIHWLYKGHWNQKGESLLMKINDKDEILFRGLDNSYNIKSIMEIYPVFSRNRDTISLRQSFNSRIYHFIDTLFIPAYEIDFGNYNIPKEFYDKDNFVEAAEFLFTKDFAIVNKFVENNEYILVEVTFWRANHSSILMAYGIKNKSKKEWKWFEIEEEESLQHIFGLNLHQLSENGEIIGVVDAWKLKEWENRDIFVNPEVIDQLKEDDNPVIMICKLAW